MNRLVLALCLGLSVTAVPLRASTPDCETLAVAASHQYGLPEGLLVAIARTESGIAQGAADRRAWPWTANVAGQSHYYNTRQEMREHLDHVVASDVSNFDVGCMQLNYHWHGDGFSDLDRMLDPETNVGYAARYLKRLYDETGSWAGATRYYHSRDPDRGAAYLERVSRVWTELAGTTIPAPDPVTPVRVSAPVLSDRRFQKHRPAGQQSDLRTYWEGVNLAEGNLPKLPGRP